MKAILRPALLGLVLAAAGLLAPPAMAQQQIELSELDKTGGLALQLALIRIDIAREECVGVTLPEGFPEKLDRNIAALSVHLDITQDEFDNRLFTRGMDVYNKDVAVFCMLWAPQVEPLIAALQDEPVTEAGGAAAVSAEIAAAEAAEEAGQGTTTPAPAEAPPAETPATPPAETPTPPPATPPATP